MTQEQYERAELIARNLRNMNYALDAMKSQDDVTLTQDYDVDPEKDWQYLEQNNTLIIGTYL